MNPQITKESLKIILSSKEYWHGNIGYSDYSTLSKVNLMTSRLRLKYLAPHLSPNASILEIGCASGQFLRVCKEQGYQVTGIDVSRFHLNKSASLVTKNNTAILHLSLEDYFNRYSNTKFDAVCMWGVEGNIPDLLDTFAKIHQCLNPCGILALNWINFDHWIRPYLFGVFRQSLTALSNLNSSSFRLLLQKTGFDQIFSTHDYQYVNLGKFCGLSGHRKLLQLVQTFHIAQISIPLPTIIGRLSILRKKSNNT